MGRGNRRGDGNHNNRGNFNRHNDRGHRSRGGFRGGRNNAGDNNGRGGGHWQPQRRCELGPISIDFPDYTESTKINELEPEMVKFLTEPEPKSEALSTSEADVGITEFVSDREGFDGILKHRYSDFIVNEIDQDGRIVRLTSLDIPPHAPVKSLSESEEIDTSSTSDLHLVPYSSLDEKVKCLFSGLTWSRLTQLAKKYAIPGKVPEQDDIKIDVTEKSKEERTALHNFLKITFPHLTGSTIEGKDVDAGKKFVVVTYKLTNFDRRDRDRNQRLLERGKHLHFVLHKVDIDSNAIFAQLGRILFPNKDAGNRCKFKIAGLKDRRGKTTQNVSITWVTAERLKSAVVKLHKPNIFAGNFSYKKEGLELGDLGGNHFTIALRGIAGDKKEVIGEALKSLHENGFINYFGLQRFGTVASIKTSDIGLALIKSKWSEAIDLILKPRPHEDMKISRARAFWWMYRDHEEAIKLLDESPVGHSASLERYLLKGLSTSNTNDFVGALNQVPKNGRQLYLHAYQSLVWNKAVSERIKRFGTKVLVGDLVLLPSKSGKMCDDDLLTIELEDDLMAENEGEDKTNGDQPKTVDSLTCKPSASVVLKKYQQLEERLVQVTDENLPQFTIFDVVMPVPGWRVKVPAHEAIASIYDELLKADGLDKGFESLRHKVEMFSLPGAYRKILVKPWNFSWKFVTHSDAHQDLILSDVEILRARSLPSEEGSGDPKFESVIVEMSLPSSAYATMALREAMKGDTSKAAQTKLTDNFRTATKRCNEADINEVADIEAAKVSKVEIAA